MRKPPQFPRERKGERCSLTTWCRGFLSKSRFVWKTKPTKTSEWREEYESLKPRITVEFFFVNLRSAPPSRSSPASANSISPACYAGTRKDTLGPFFLFVCYPWVPLFRKIASLTVYGLMSYDFWERRHNESESQSRLTDGRGDKMMDLYTAGCWPSLFTSTINQSHFWRKKKITIELQLL